MSNPLLDFDLTITIPKQRIADLLCCAFEGGSNYWYIIKESTPPAEMPFRSDPSKVFKHLDFPLNPFGRLTITTDEGDEINGKKEWPLDIPAIERGLRVFIEKYPLHFSDFLIENEDATTGDCFLQCCLFGEVVYG